MRKSGRAIERLIAVWHRLLAIVRRRRLDQGSGRRDRVSPEHARGRVPRVGSRRGRCSVRGAASIWQRDPSQGTDAATCGLSHHLKACGRTCGMRCGHCGERRRSSSVAIVVLAIGIAGNTAMFSLVDAVRLARVAVRRIRPARDPLGQRDAREARAARRFISGLRRLALAVDDVRRDGGGRRDPHDPVGLRRSHPHPGRNSISVVLFRFCASTLRRVVPLPPTRTSSPRKSLSWCCRRVLAPAARRRSASRRTPARARRATLHGHRHHAARLPRRRRSGGRLDSVRHEQYRRGAGSAW